MKKIFIFLSSLCLFVFAACNSEPVPVQDGPSNSSITGVLEVQELGDSLKGTHLIRDAVGGMTPVRSLSINLSSKKYLGNMVEAIGSMNTIDDVFEISGLTVVELLSSDSVLADFSSYKNSDLGIKLKYYSDWSLKEDSDEVVFLAPLEEGFTNSESVKVTHFVFNYDMDSFDSKYNSALEAYFMEETGAFPADSLSKIGPDMLDAVKIDISNGPVEYTLYRSGLIYKIQFFPSKNPGYDDEKRIFNEMVSAFQFIGFSTTDMAEDTNEDVVADKGESAPTLNMELTSFESLPYSFRGVYPSSWYYAGVLASASGVFHHYGFSNVSVDDSNEIISLDVIDQSLMKSGTRMTINSHAIDIVSSGGNYTAYVNVADRYFRVKGPTEYKDLVLNMASNITHIEPVSP